MMENVCVKEFVKTFPINKLELGLGKSALKKAGIETVGEVLALIDNKNLESIEGIGKKTVGEIENKTHLKLTKWQEEINYFYTLPPEKEKWLNYLRLLRVIFGVKEDEKFFSEASINYEGIIEALDTLTPREERVIKLRFGLIDGRYSKFDEVAKEFSISRERVRQIEAKAFRKLRHPSRKRKMIKM